MLLADIVLDCQKAYGARYQCSSAKIVQFINTIQQVAFNRDLKAFLWWQDYLTIYQDVILSSSGYTPFVAGDVGKTLTNGSVTGTIISFNNTAYTVQVSTTGTFAGTLSTTTGTGGGTFLSQAVSKGPYSWASLNPLLGSLTGYTQAGGVRRMLGLTRATESQLYTPNNISLSQDYGFSATIFDDRALFENVHKYDIQKALFFIDTPVTTASTYRWVYYLRPPTISATTDDANLLIPSEYHETVVKEGVGLLADRSTYGNQAPEQVLSQVIQPFWDMMQQAYTPDGVNNNFTSEGQL